MGAQVDEPVFNAPPTSVVPAPPASNNEAASAAAAEATAVDPAPAPVVGFASLPEGAFLRVIAQVDIPSGISLTSAGGVTRESTQAGLSFLTDQIERAREAHRAETAAIAAEREAVRARHEREQQVRNEALGHLAALRLSAIAARPEFQSVIQQLEAAPEGVQEAEEDFAVRAARADYTLQVRELTARSRVAEGELQAISSH